MHSKALTLKLHSTWHSAQQSAVTVIDAVTVIAAYPGIRSIERTQVSSAGQIRVSSHNTTSPPKLPTRRACQKVELHPHVGHTAPRSQDSGPCLQRESAKCGQGSMLIHSLWLGLRCYDETLAWGSCPFIMVVAVSQDSACQNNQLWVRT